MVLDAKRIHTLEHQQQLLTDSLLRMLQGEWTSFPSLEADLYALDPGCTLEPNPPLLSDDGEVIIQPSWWDVFDAYEHMPRQSVNWTCAACALAWVERATAANPTASEWTAVDEIGCPANINGTYGLMDGSGRELQRVLHNYGLPSRHGWLSWAEAYATYGQTTGMMSGGAWYHWIAVRGTSGADLWIANSAPGYKGIFSTLSREQFLELGPFSCVWLQR